MVSVDLLGGEGAPSEVSEKVDYGDVPYDQLPVPSDTWEASVAHVPGDDGEGEEFDEEDMEARIRAKYQPSKLAGLSNGEQQEVVHSRAPIQATYEAPTNPGAVYACAYCDGQGKIYKVIPLSNLGDKGTTRTIESCCQSCKGFGVINTLDKKLNEPEGPTARRPEPEAQAIPAAQQKRLDTEDPPVDMEALLAAAGPSPFARGAARKVPSDLKAQD